MERSLKKRIEKLLKKHNFCYVNKLDYSDDKIYWDIVSDIDNFPYTIFPPTQEVDGKIISINYKLQRNAVLYKNSEGKKGYYFGTSFVKNLILYGKKIYSDF